MFEKRDSTSELTTYIKKNLMKGYTKESLKWALRNQGYSKIEVERAFQKSDEEMSKEAPSIPKEKPKIEYTAVPFGEEPKKSFWKKWF